MGFTQSYNHVITEDIVPQFELLDLPLLENMQTEGIDSVHKVNGPLGKTDFGQDTAPDLVHKLKQTKLNINDLNAVLDIKVNSKQWEGKNWHAYGTSMTSTSHGQ